LRRSWRSVVGRHARGQRRGELAGGEGVEGAEAGGEFAFGQLAFAEERAEKILGAAGAFLGVAFPTAGDEVAVRIVARVRAWDDVVNALHGRGEQAQTIETAPGLAGMDGVTQGVGAQEVLLFEVDPGNRRDRVAGRDLLGEARENLLGQTHVHDVTGGAAFDKAEQFLVDEPAHRAPGRVARQADTAGQPGHGKAEPRLSFEAAMPQKITVGGAVGDRQTEPRHERIF